MTKYFLTFPLRSLRFLFAIIGLFYLTSCTEKKTEPHIKGIYFDLAGYFKSEAKKLSAKKPEVKKTIIKDGASETKLLSDSIDWIKELKIFEDADINKPAWQKSFEGDTIKGEGIYTITYKTADEKIPVKEMVIVTDSIWQPTSISLKRNAQNFLYTSQQTLHYIPGKSYRLDSDMNVRWTFETKFSVEGVFTK